MKKGIAFFDFDGTITKRDSLLEFIKFSNGRLRFFLGFLMNSPWLLAYKIKLISNQRAKEKILSFFFRNTVEKDFNEQCCRFAQNVLPGLLRPGALDEIKKLKERNILVVVVSASPENWIKKWAEGLQVELIASRLETRNGRLTGNILGKNCHGKEKVRRILEQHVMSDYDVIYAYGDSRGDRPMLELATNSFYRPFRN